MNRRDLRDKLAARFEIGRHSLSPSRDGAKPVAGSPYSRLTFRSGSGEEVRAFYAPPSRPAAPSERSEPSEPSEPSPALLYIHAHGNRYDIGAREVLDGRPALQSPLGPILSRLGYAVLCIDLPGFGARAHQSESALAKAALWRGTSLAGQMIGELHAAFQWLRDQNGVDPKRVGVFGLSMGATLGYWLAAAEPKVAAVAHLCCLADFAALIDAGAHDLHGAYLTVPGLLNLAANGEIAGLIAPRPQFVGLGDLDPLTPARATDPTLAQLRQAYAAAPDRLVVLRDAGSGHEETPEMRRTVLEFFRTSLRPDPGNAAQRPA